MAHLTFIPHAASKLPTPTKPLQTCPRHQTAHACAEQPPPSKETVDKLFSRLTHVNKNLRVKASAAIAELGGSDNVARLAQLLELEDTAHRRAAVQALGMTGLEAVPTLVRQLRESANSTVRASCSKGLAAVALYFPEMRASFPDEALDALEAALGGDPDPVTKLATVGCLGTLGSDLKGKGDSVISGSERAVSILLSVCQNSMDVAVGAVAVGAIAQIAQNGTPERKAQIIAQLEKLAAKEEEVEEAEESGFNYIQEMATAHLDQLRGGTGVQDD